MLPAVRLLPSRPHRLMCTNEEIIKNHNFFLKPAEIWTLGMLLCNIVYNCPAFDNEEDQAAGRLYLPDRLPNEKWTKGEGHSMCLDILRRCLRANPEERATIEELSAHPWFKSSGLARAPRVATS